MLKAVIFDRDGVLGDFDLLRARRTMERLLPLGLSEFERYLRAYAATAPPPIDGRSEDAFWRSLWDRLAADFDIAPADYAALCRFDPHSLLSPYPDAERALSRAKDCGHRVGVLSNFSLLDLGRSLTSLGLADYVDTALSAAQIGHAKPKAQAYLAVARALEVKPTECVFVDDRQEHVDGAQRVGMRAHLLCRDAPESTPARLATLDALFFE